MKIRGLLIATIVFLILAGLLYYSNHHKPAEEAVKASNEHPSILKLDEANINKLEIKKKDSPAIVLARNSSGSWQITEPKAYGADQSTMNGALASLSALNSERVVEDKAADLKRYGLDQPAIEVDVTEKDNKTQKVLFGDDTPAGGAVYAMLAGDPRVFTVSSYNKNSVNKSLDDWRDKRLLTANPDKISRVELIRKDQTIEFGRNKDEWQILEPKPLRADNFAVSELIRKLTDARMDLSGTEADNKESTSAFAHATPVATAKLTDESGSQNLEVRKSKDTYYGKSSVVEGTYKLSSDLGAELDKSLDDFRNKKLFDFGFNDPNKVELHNGAKAYYLTRSGEDWWSNGKKMDAGMVQTFIAKMRDLSASKFIESGFANPTIEADVTSDDGKRVEKVSFAKSGNDYVAKRENDSGLYQVDSSAVDDLLKAADDIKTQK
ncbi:MAG TPA: DUF4340 domain-containing protein [Terriglobales bacterium]|nr:DUF4340 domain-containing protein [Terriglobales bacterium]